jgi:hypothetical protein
MRIINYKTCTLNKPHIRIVRSECLPSWRWVRNVVDAKWKSEPTEETEALEIVRMLWTGDELRKRNNSQKVKSRLVLKGSRQACKKY